MYSLHIFWFVDGDGDIKNSIEVLQEIKSTNVEYVSFQSDGSYLIVSSKSTFEPKSESRYIIDKFIFLMMWKISCLSS